MRPNLRLISFKSSQEAHRLTPENNKFDKTVKILAVISLFFVSIGAVKWLYSFSDIKTQYSIAQFLPENHPRLAMDRNVRKTFGISEQSAFVVTVQLKESWMNRKNLQLLKTVTEDLKSVKDVQKTISVGNLNGAFFEKGNLIIGSVIDHAKDKQLKEKLLDDPLITPGLLSQDGKTALIYVETTDANFQEFQQLQKNLKSKVQRTFKSAYVGIGGVPAIQGDISLLLDKEVRRFALLAIVFIMLGLLIVFYGYLSTIVTALILIIANAWMIGFMLMAKVPLTVLTTTLPIIISIAVVSLIVRGLMRFYEVMQLHPEQSKARNLIKSQRELLLPNFLASFTTAVGFLTLIACSSPIIRQYGLAVAGGIALTWIVATLTYIPLVLFFPIIKPRKWVSKPASWSLFITSHPKLVLSIGAAVFGTLAIIGINLKWEGRLFDDLPSVTESRKVTELIDQELGGMVAFDLVIDSGKDGFWTDPKNIKQLEVLTETLRTTVGIGSVRSLSDFLKISGNSKRSKGSLAETYFLFSLNSENPLKRYLTADSRKVRLELRLRDLPQERSQLLMAKVERITKHHFNARLEFGGMGSTVHIVNKEVAKDLIFGFWHALIAISIFLTFILRSWRLAFIAIIPNLSSPAALMGFLVLTSTPVKPSIALVFSIALGLAYDNTLYLLNRLRQIRNESGRWQIARAFYLESHPCLLSTLVVASGFFAFLLSYFDMNKVFGTFMLISISAALIGDLVLFPAILKLMPDWFWPKTKPTQKPKLTIVPPLGTEEKKDYMQIAASIAIVVVLGLLSFSAQAEVSSDDLLKRAKKNLYTSRERMKIRMKILEKGSDAKIRELDISRLSEDDHRFYAQIQKPADIKGMAFLSIVKGEDEQRWVYLPSSKTTRKIVGGSQSNEGILGSDLTAEDLNLDVLKNAKTKILKRQGKNLLVEANLTSGPYTKMWLLLNEEKALPLSLEYFTKNKKMKRIEFTDYKKFETVWRASKINVANLVLSRSTEVELLGWDAGPKLKARDLSSQNLAQKADD